MQHAVDETVIKGMASAPSLNLSDAVLEPVHSEVGNNHTTSNVTMGDQVAVVFQTIGVFLLSGLCEIGGGWLVWGSLREYLGHMCNW